MSDERGLTSDTGKGPGEPGLGGTEPAERSDVLEVYLAPTRRAHLPGPLGWLALRFGLDVFGGSLLGRQANLALRFSALLLLVIVSFDLMAWSLLFNSIFHASGDILHINGWTVLAAAFGLLFACAIFIYERQFFTADTSDIFSSFWRFLSVAAAVSLRVAILAAAALITAQPVELLIFREPIRKRVHEEALRQEVVARRRQIDELKEKLKTLALQPAALDARMKGTKEEAALIATEQDLKREKGFLSQFQRQLKGAQSSRAALPPGSDDSILRDTIHQINSQIQNQRNIVREKEGFAQTARENYEKRRNEVYGGEVAQKANFEEIMTMVRRYIDDVAKKGIEKSVSLQIPLADPRIPAEQKTFSYRFRGTDFFDQLRVLQDRLQGRQARWPAGVPQNKRSELSLEFALDQLTDGQESGIAAGARQCPPYPWSGERAVDADPEVDRRIAESCLLKRSYGVAYAIALVIPLLVFAIKFLMPRELKHYFSVRQQAWAGNPEAMSYLRGEEKRKTKRRRTEWTPVRQQEPESDEAVVVPRRLRWRPFWRKEPANA